MGSVLRFCTLINLWRVIGALCADGQCGKSGVDRCNLRTAFLATTTPSWQPQTLHKATPLVKSSFGVAPINTIEACSEQWQSANFSRATSQWGQNSSIISPSAHSPDNISTEWSPSTAEITISPSYPSTLNFKWMPLVPWNVCSPLSKLHPLGQYAVVAINGSYDSEDCAVLLDESLG